MHKLSLEFHEPSPKQPCLCGSGKKFKKCCGPLYQTDEKNDCFEKFNKGNYKDALKACRLHITWYILCHRAHTIPWLESESKEAYELLEIDIEALSSSLDLLFNCYEETGKHKDFPHALDSLTNAISDQRWFNRIAYQRALWVIIDSNDRKLAFHELNKIKDITSVSDRDILTLYLDIYSEEMPFSKRIKLIDQILASNPDDANRLHYTALKGIHYFLIGDEERGNELIKNAIDNFKKLNKEVKAGYANYCLAQALEILGELTNNKKLMKEAQDCYRREIESKTYNSNGYAMLFKQLGDSLYASEDYTESIINYENSLKEKDDELTKIFYAKSLIQKGDVIKAEDLLNKIVTEHCDSPEQYDFAISWAQLALRTERKHHTTQAIKLLQSLKPSMPYFNKNRDDLLLELMQIEKDEGKGIVGKLTQILTRYTILQPNFCGLGINLNNILDDVKERLKHKKDF